MDFHIIKSNIVEPVLSKVTVNGGGGGIQPIIVVKFH